ncbi:hypothetical protein QYE76_007498 [Lolium multiflorum]|uniref:non-specific serine/threonine protein kinase n=1 Tax=Lolium multiflorum TaxID=4521 RepID=A0AAD8W578_LOLMU|nr:hypothetical protein QYE76_007498 [Lolium multiflorum]
MQVWLECNEDSGQINVTLVPVNMVKPTKPLLCTNYNLSTVITDLAYVGFSSSTGSFIAKHYVLGWSFGMNRPAPSIDITRLPKLPRQVPKPLSKILEIILPIATATFVLVIGTIAILLIQRRLRYAEGMKEFVAEVVSIGHLQHRNLVSLHGYCHRKCELILVYEYMSNGRLDKYLYDQEKATLSWAQRFRIIKGIASGLLYLHEQWEKVVLHRDIKLSNVLLDDELNARLVIHLSSTKFFFLCFLLFFGIDLAFFSTTGDGKLLYLGFTGTSLTVDNAATITSNGLLELTNGSVNCKGHAFHPIPLHFRKSHDDTVQSFSVAFVFAIRSSYPIMSLHGMAFIIAPSTNFSDAVASQYLGFMNSQNNGNMSNHIFAVELDTILNIEFDDINDNHAGIDINNLHSIQSYPAGYYDNTYSSFQNMSLISGDAMQVWVDYNGEAKKISVTMAPIQMAKPTRPLISAYYDLSTVLKEPSYIGFSSSTSAADSRHYVLGWSFGMNKPAPVINIAQLPKLPRQVRSISQSSWKSFYQ